MQQNLTPRGLDFMKHFSRRKVGFCWSKNPHQRLHQKCSIPFFLLERFQILHRVFKLIGDWKASSHASGLTARDFGQRRGCPSFLSTDKLTAGRLTHKALWDLHLSRHELKHELITCQPLCCSITLLIKIQSFSELTYYSTVVILSS